MSNLQSLTTSFRRSLAIHGIAATAKLAGAAVVRRLLSLSPSRRRADAEARERELEFDRAWGVDTGGMTVPAESDVVGGNWVYGIKYQAVNAGPLDHTLRGLRIAHEQFTFIDFGSGKGRALLVAAALPFRSVIGVEYSAPLNEIALGNLRAYPEGAKNCGSVTSICADAAEFPIPPGPLVLFFFCPFGRPVMERVAHNVAASYRRDPRRIIVVYFNPLFGDVWKGTGFIREISSSRDIAIYDTDPDA